MSDELDGLYRERARLVAHLSAVYPSVMAYSDPDAPYWAVVYTDTPQGQLSWHVASQDMDLFSHVLLVPAYDPRARWDGHTTTDKYQRLAQLTDEVELAKRIGGLG